METYKYLFLFFTLILGIVTIVTDNLYQKIKNTHLCIALIFILSCYALITSKGGVPINITIFLSNLITGFSIGYLLFLTDSWGGGDGKLFFIYSLLVTENLYSSLFPLVSLVIFANIFISGLLFFVGLSFYEIICNILQSKVKAENNFKKEFKIEIKNFVLNFVVILSFGWLYSWFSFQCRRFTVYPFTGFLFFYFILLFIKYVSNLIENRSKAIFWSIVFLSMTYQLVFFQNYFFSLINLKSIFCLTVMIYIPSRLFKKTKIYNDDKKTVTFAPIMLAGVLLSQTNFLYFVINVLRIK